MKSEMNNENLPALTGRNGHGAAMSGEGFSMQDLEQEPKSPGLNPYDILFILFRHKWKILLCAATGMLAAAAVYLLLPPVYVSEAKLFVRYVVDKSAIDGLDSQIKTPNPQTDTLINSEVQILGSSDLAREVAQAIGVERLDARRRTLKPRWRMQPRAIYSGLNISVVQGTNIISIAFRSGNPKLPMPILQELVKRYFDKHLEVHRSVGAFDFVTKETAGAEESIESDRRRIERAEGQSWNHFARRKQDDSRNRIGEIPGRI